jgi:hypothetical protein
LKGSTFQRPTLNALALAVAFMANAAVTNGAGKLFMADASPEDAQASPQMARKMRHLSREIQVVDSIFCGVKR